MTYSIVDLSNVFCFVAFSDTAGLTGLILFLAQ